MHRSRSRFALSLVLCAFVLSLSTPAWALKPVPVKVGKHADYYGSGTDTWLVWNELRPHTKAHYDVWAQQTGHKSFRLNTGNSVGFLGQIDPHGTEVVFQQVHRGNSDIRVMDLATRHFVSLPSGINTKNWEWASSLSDNRLLFARIEQGRDVLLEDADITASPADPLVTIASYDRTSKGYSRLDSSTRSAGSWSTWSAYTGRAYNSFRYEPGSGIERVPNPGHKRDEYSSSVLDDGTVLMARSGLKCGQQVHLASWDGSSAPQTILAIPHGIDVNDTAAWTDGANTTLWFSRFRCAAKTFDIDIYELSNFLARTSPTGGARAGSPFGSGAASTGLRRTPLTDAMSGSSEVRAR